MHLSNAVFPSTATCLLSSIHSIVGLFSAMSDHAAINKRVNVFLDTVGIVGIQSDISVINIQINRILPPVLV